PEPQRHRSHERAEESGHCAGGRDPHRGAHAVIGAQDGAGVGAGGEEEGVAERDLARVAHEDVEAGGADGGDDHEGGRREVGRAQPERKDHGEAGERDYGAGAHERAGHHRRSAGLTPSSPYGRTSRMAIMTTYGATA